MWIQFILDGVKYEEAEIGVGLERVLRYFTIRGKLTHVISGSGVGFSTGVDSGLRAFGVKKIEIDFQSEEVAFIFEGKKIICFCYLFSFDNETTNQMYWL